MISFMTLLAPLAERPDAGGDDTRPDGGPAFNPEVEFGEDCLQRWRKAFGTGSVTDTGFQRLWMQTYCPSSLSYRESEFADPQRRGGDEIVEGFCTDPDG